jgi:hypothetical protein
MPCQTPLLYPNAATIRENIIIGVAGFKVSDRKISQASDS